MFSVACQLVHALTHDARAQHSYPAGGAFNKARAAEKNDLNDFLIDFLDPYEKSEDKQWFIRDNILPRIKILRWVGNLDTGHRIEPPQDEKISSFMQRLRDLRKRIKSVSAVPQKKRGRPPSKKVESTKPPPPSPSKSLSILKRPAARKPRLRRPSASRTTGASQIKNASAYAARLKSLAKTNQPGLAAGAILKPETLSNNAGLSITTENIDLFVSTAAKKVDAPSSTAKKKSARKRKGPEPSPRTPTPSTPKRKKPRVTNGSKKKSVGRGVKQAVPRYPESEVVDAPKTKVGRLITLTPDGNLAWQDGRIFSYCRNPPPVETPTVTLFPKGDAFTELRASQPHDIDELLIKFLKKYEATPDKDKTKFIKTKVVTTMEVLLWDGTPTDGGPVVPRRSELCRRIMERLDELCFERKASRVVF